MHAIFWKPNILSSLLKVYIIWYITSSYLLHHKVIITCDDVCDKRAHNHFKNKDKNPVQDILRKSDSRSPLDPRGSTVVQN